MSVSCTVIMNCAGMGTRLGISRTKSLIDVLGKPLIHWQLEMLKDVADVRIVVGYQAEEVIDCVLAIRRDVMFVHNHDYATTKTAASLCLGSRHAQGMVVSLDGDLLVHPNDFRNFLNHPSPCLSACDPSSDQPVYLAMKGEQAVEFTREPTRLEWNGLVKIDAACLQRAARGKLPQGHVYQMLSPYLPLDVVTVRGQDIDTPDDYARTLAWFKTVCEEDAADEHTRIATKSGSRLAHAGAKH